MKEIEKKLKSVKASNEIEGLYLSKEMEELVVKEAKGEITFKEFEKRVMKLAENNE